MESLLEPPKINRIKTIFTKIEEKDNRTIYHTKAMMDLCTFGINEKHRHRFYVFFRSLSDVNKLYEFNLFSIRGDDKFFGIFYGYRKPIKKIVTRYEENGAMKISTLSEIYYIEFRFKTGSIFCYMKGIARLIKKEKQETPYNKLLLRLIIDLEKQVHEFYNKKIPKGGIFTRWIERNLQ